MELKIEQDLFENEARLAEENRILFKNRELVVINILAGPGAGKTSLIKRISQLSKHPIAVIEGDPASRIDTDTLLGLGIPAYQINTEGGCHLNAVMIAKALQEFQPQPKTVLFIENVGNLICTAVFPLGEALRVVIQGVSEGDDKPFKYPDIFQGADAVILNKIDLLPYVDFDLERFNKGIKILNPDLPIFNVSCKTEEGLEKWVEWLDQKVNDYWNS